MRISDWSSDVCSSDLLAKLHRLDPDAVGLGDLGKPQGFLNRAVEGWIKRATLATSDWGRARTDALIVELSRWMRANVVPDQNIVLLHNDYKLDNIDRKSTRLNSSH